MMGQAMLIISDLLTTQLLNVQELDPIRRYLPSATRPKSGGRYSSFEVSTGVANLNSPFENQFTAFPIIMLDYL